MHRFAQIEMLVAVVEEGSFTAAAERLNVSKSHVSRQVADLEERMGVRLLNRTTRQISTTPEGASFVERCAGILEEFERAERALTQRRRDPVGTLKIAAPMSFGIKYLSPVLADFLNEYDGIDAEVHFSDRKVDVVDEGFDVAVRAGRLEDSSLIVRKLRDVDGHVCASPDYLDEHGRPEHPRDLTDHDCLLYSYLSAGERWIFERDGREEAVPVSGSLTANNGEALTEAARRDVGLILCPEFIVADALERGDLVRLLDDWSIHSGGVWVLYPHRRHLAAKVRVFVDYLQDRLGERSRTEG
ncbi:MAG: LysR family transcriptional regulator [Bradymonadaceae bacterium]